MRRGRQCPEKWLTVRTVWRPSCRVREGSKDSTTAWQAATCWMLGRSVVGTMQRPPALGDCWRTQHAAPPPSAGPCSNPTIRSPKLCCMRDAYHNTAPEVTTMRQLYRQVAAPVTERVGDRQGAGASITQAAGLHWGSAALEVAGPSRGGSRLPAGHWADGR